MIDMEHKQPTSAYTKVDVTDDAEELLSSTEVDELDLIAREDEEKQRWRSPGLYAEQQKKSRIRRYVARWRRYRWMLDTLLLLVNISLSVLLLKGFWTENSSSTMQIGSDFTRAGPDFPTKIVKFNADPAFVPNDTAEFFLGKTLAQWNTMMPAGTGWGSVTDETFFTTSMTHQLHCVFMMARIYSALVAPNMQDKLPSDYHSHYLHCVDYLRQGIMCSADLAMEPHEQTDADDNGPLDGSWNGHHVCKDYGHVIPYLEEQIAEGIRTVLPIDD